MAMFLKGKDVSYNHLKVFDCRALDHIPKDEIFNLDSKSKECILLGYSGEEFRYTYEILSTKRLLGEMSSLKIRILEVVKEVKNLIA